MQITVTPPGPPGLMELSVFGRPTHESQQFVQNLNQQFMAQVGGYGAQAMEFYNRSMQYFDNFSQTSGIKTAEALIDLGLATTDPETAIIPVYDLEGLRKVSVRYQEYLMANPVVRELYLADRVEGYVDTYYNYQGNAIGMNHDPYREVISGVNRGAYDELPEGVDEEFVITCQDHVDDAVELSSLNKFNIINAWGIQNAAVHAGHDPTSIDGFKVRKAKE